MKKQLVLSLHAFIGWMFCGLVMGAGRGLVSLKAALVIHALLAPLGFVILTTVYFKKFAYTTPFYTALFFVFFIIFMDVLIVAPFIEKSFAMFYSILGFFLPLILIFFLSLFTGLYMKKNYFSK
jgi:hypothetical protein